MAHIAFDVDDDILRHYQESDSDVIVLTLSREDSLNGYGWHTSAKMEYLQSKNIHEGPRRTYRHVWQTAYKAIRRFAVIDITGNNVVIDVTNAKHCDEEYLTCSSCKRFICDACSIKKRLDVDELTDARLCLEYRQVSE